MTYGLQIFAEDGVTKTFDSTYPSKGCVVDIVTAGINSQLKVYDAFNTIDGRSAYALLVGGFSDIAATPTTSAGHPAITIPAYYSTAYNPGVYMVFIL